MLRGGEKEAAAGLLEGLRSRDGASWDVLHSLGDVYGQSRDYDRAVASYRAALEVDPGRAVTLNNLAWQYAQRGENLDEGIALVTDAISQEPDNVAFLDTLAELLYRKDQPREALRVIEQALTLQPGAVHLLEQRDRFREAARR
ncbi:tetratricopeptide repeat protein [Myxococcota bacterium]|nr:tetratricopeptide repeat protein [Myxococcota bacterium]